MKEIFNRIFLDNTWGNSDSRSGDGGSASQTTTIRAVLPEVIAALNVRTLFDVPCGDFNWLRLVNLTVDYTGADIVPDLISQNQKKYGGASRRFIVHDITHDKVPKVDLILCRDLLVHFSFEYIRLAYANILRSGSTYLLSTTFPTREENKNIMTGEWRPLNLALPPFNFPSPLRMINENCTEWDGYWADKSLGLWRIADLPLDLRW